MDTLPFFIKQTLTSATPLLLAGTGELLAQRAGVINVAIEGTMLMGAISAFAAATLFNSAAAALPAAIAAGLLFALLFAITTVWCSADQIVAGTALNLLAFGASTTLWRVLQTYIANGHTPPALFNPLRPPAPNFLSPFLDQYPLYYLLFPLFLALFLLKYTRFWLVLRSLGDAPDACRAAGIPVRLYRTLLLLFAGALSGLAGAYLSTMRNHSFQINMTGGQGFLVLALVIFGRWHLPTFAAGTLAFGLIDSLQTFLAASPEATRRLPHQLFDMLPYACTLLALALFTRAQSGPAKLGRPWPEL